MVIAFISIQSEAASRRKTNKRWVKNSSFSKPYFRPANRKSPAYRAPKRSQDASRRSYGNQAGAASKAKANKKSGTTRNYGKNSGQSSDAPMKSGGGSCKSGDYSAWKDQWTKAFLSGFDEEFNGKAQAKRDSFKGPGKEKPASSYGKVGKVQDVMSEYFQTAAASSDTAEKDTPQGRGATPNDLCPGITGKTQNEQRLFMLEVAKSMACLESELDPNIQSNHIGIFQLAESTMKLYGCEYTDVKDPEQQARCMPRIMAVQLSADGGPIFSGRDKGLARNFEPAKAGARQGSVGLTTDFIRNHVRGKCPTLGSAPTNKTPPSRGLIAATRGGASQQ